MRCFFTFAVAAALAAGLSATSWSQTSGGAGSSGTGGASGTSGAGATGSASGGTAAGTGTPGASGNVGTATPGASGNVGPATPGASGNANNVGTAGAAGTAGTKGNAGANAAGAGAANGVNNRANGVGTNNRANGTGRLNNANGNNGQFGFQNNSAINRTPFFTDPGVRKQLNLNDNQFNTLNRSYQNAYTKYNEGLKKLNDPNLTEQQREQQMQLLEMQFNQNLSSSVNSTFTNPQMNSRFGQLNRQYQGFNAFNDPVVRKQLNLSQDQIRQLRTLSSNWRQQLQQLRRSGGASQNSVDPAQWAQLQRQYVTQLSGVLTPEQQQMWSQRIGEPYLFSPNVYFDDQQPGNVNPGTQPGGNQTPERNSGSRVHEPLPGTQTPASPQATTPGTGTQGGTAQGTQGAQGTTVR